MHLLLARIKRGDDPWDRLLLDLLMSPCNLGAGQLPFLVAATEKLISFSVDGQLDIIVSEQQNENTLY